MWLTLWIVILTWKVSLKLEAFYRVLFLLNRNALVYFISEKNQKGRIYNNGYRNIGLYFQEDEKKIYTLVKSSCHLNPSQHSLTKLLWWQSQGAPQALSWSLNLLLLYFPWNSVGRSSSFLLRTVESEAHSGGFYLMTDLFSEWKLSNREK